MHKRWYVLLLLLCSVAAVAQKQEISVSVMVTANERPLPHASVELRRKTDSMLVKIQATDAAGRVQFVDVREGSYFLHISGVGYRPLDTDVFNGLPGAALVLNPVTLTPSTGTLDNVTVAARKPVIEVSPGKTTVNLDAGISNAGTTVMEALEKMPGISIDRDGNISLKGKAGVTVMIDGRPVYLSGSDLATLLNGMSASGVSQVELMDQPSSRYDAAGNAGIINIKTKKNRQKGFNGSATIGYGQGRYPKNNNSLQLNFRTGPWNFFANYSMNLSRNFTRIYALRTYFKDDGTTIASLLEQPSMLRGEGYTHSLRAGIDYTISDHTTVGLGLTGLSLERKSHAENPAQWMNAQRVVDSLIVTQSESRSNWNNAGVNVNLHHQFNASQTLSADVDLIGYRIRGRQFFENRLMLPGSYTEATRASLPSDLHIFSAKVDYDRKLGQWKLEAGAKTSHITTDNLSDYEFLEGQLWKPDYGKTNHFLYAENIHALYANGEAKLKKWTMQGGLRYEMTAYDAEQLGNVLRPDSSFSRRYKSIFPSFFASFAADSNNSFSLSTGRRIDRPPFQKLNPFVLVINKYTYQQGNPFYRPQYTWNVELSHVYKGMLITGISYSVTRDYFSQVFPIDTSGIVIYTEGNLGRLQNLGISLSAQLAPLSWWSLSAQAVFNHKKMEGVIGQRLRSSISQFSLNWNNQFRMKKGWSAELTGFYTSKSQNDIQEIVDPAGQLSLGLAKAVLGNKGTIKLSARDIFYTQWMKGLTHFTLATEYFKLTRDTRVLTLSFTYRFGKAYKTGKRSEGAAGEEIQRVGNG